MTHLRHTFQLHQGPSPPPTTHAPERQNTPHNTEHSQHRTPHTPNTTEHHTEHHNHAPQRTCRLPSPRPPQAHHTPPAADALLSLNDRAPAHPQHSPAYAHTRANTAHCTTLPTRPPHMPPSNTRHVTPAAPLPTCATRPLALPTPLTQPTHFPPCPSPPNPQHCTTTHGTHAPRGTTHAPRGTTHTPPTNQVHTPPTYPTHTRHAAPPMPTTHPSK